MVRAILLSRRTIFDKDGKIISKIRAEDITSFDVSDQEWIEEIPICTNADLKNSLKVTGIPIRDIPLQQFERKFEENPPLVHAIIHDQDLSSWIYGIAREFKTNTINEVLNNLNLVSIPTFSAVKFKAGRASAMKNNILTSLKRHENEHFAPELLTNLVNQDYQFHHHFDANKMQKVLRNREFDIYWSKQWIDEEETFVPKIRKIGETEWKPAHFLEMRKKMQDNLETIDKDIEVLILKQAVTILGTKDDPKVLEYALMISQIHTVFERRFCPIERKNKLRIRECIDNWILNDVTTGIKFRMLTASDLTLSLGEIESFTSYDNKTSYYNSYLSPLARRSLCFVWRDLIACFNVPVFGIANAPAFNECFMCLSHLVLHEVLQTFDLLQYIFVSTTWIDDTIFGIKKGSGIIAKYAPTFPLFALICLQMGITLNVQKSTPCNSQIIDYLGLQFAVPPNEQPWFQVKKKLIFDLQVHLLNSVKVEDKNFKDIILSEKFAEEGWDIFSEDNKSELLQHNLRFKTVEEFMGKLGWINRNNTVDTEVFHLMLLYRSSEAWKLEKIITKAKIELFNAPKILKRQIYIRQKPNPLNIDFYVRLDWFFHKNIKKQEELKVDLYGIPPFDVFNIFGYKLNNAGEHHVWIRDGTAMTSLLQQIQDDLLSHSMSALKTNTNYSEIGSETAKGTFILSIRVADTRLITFPASITQRDLIAIDMLSLLKKRIWGSLAICVQVIFIRKPPKTMPKVVSYIQPLQAFSAFSKWTHKNAVILFKNECKDKKLYEYNGWSIAWNIHNSIGSQFATWNHISFWKQFPKKKKYLLINTESRKIINRICQVIGSKPPEIEIWWVFRNKKLLRLVLAITSRVTSKLLHLPGDLFAEKFRSGWKPLRMKQIPILSFPMNTGMH